MSKGRKYDGGKRRYDLLPPGPLGQICDVITYGAAKYEANNWQKVESERYVAALYRHLEAWRDGETNDEESGLHHLAHAGCNILFLLWQARTQRQAVCVPGTMIKINASEQGAGLTEDVRRAP